MKLLPLHIAGALTQSEASRELALETMRRENPPRPIDPRSSKAERIATHRCNRALSKLAAATESERHHKLLTTASYLFGMIDGGWNLDPDDVERGLIASMAQNGGLAKYGEREIQRCINDARRNAPSIAVEVQETPPNSPKPLQNVTVSTPNHAGIVQSSADLTPVKVEIAPLTQEDFETIMPISPDAGLIMQNMISAGLADDFTVADFAAAGDIKTRTAYGMINRALISGFIRECRLPDFGTITGKDSIVPKNGKRANEGRHFCINPTPDETRLADAIQELLTNGDPDVIHKDDALAAGLSPDDSELVELATQTISESIDAFEVRAKAERTAARIARQLLRARELKQTPFAPGETFQTIGDLRAALGKAKHATDPDRAWIQAEYRWIMGVKTKGVSAYLIKGGLVPAAIPTFINEQLSGRNLHAAVKELQRKHHGSPVAWLDAQGEAICSFSHEVPTAATGVRLNVGKKYYPAAAAPAAEPLPPSLQPEKTPAPEPTEVEKAEREVKRARCYLLPTLRGNMAALGATLTTGAFGYWLLNGEVIENTFDGMIAVMVREGKRLQTETPPAVELPPPAAIDEPETPRSNLPYLHLITERRAS